jgi:hypothetical protein
MNPSGDLSRPRIRSIDWLKLVETWLNPRRITVALAIVLSLNLAISIALVMNVHDLLDWNRQPLGGDFIIFYSASSLTLKGQAILAFTHKFLLAAQQSVIAAVPPGLVWSYPPPFQLLTAPLALASFGVSLALWTAAGVGAYLAALRPFVRDAGALLMVISFPGLFGTAWNGQTSLFVMAVLGFGLMALDRRPWRAGLILGLLICKPQFAVLLPLLVVGTGRWRTVLGAAVTVTVLGLLSAAIFGLPLWAAFLNNLAVASTWISTGALSWVKVPTVFVTLAWLGAPHGIAWACQWTVAAVVALATLAAWRQPGPLGLKVAMAVCATLLVTPYVMNYDLVLLAIPIAAVAAYGRDATLPSGTKLILILAFAASTIFVTVAERIHVQLTPLALLALFWGIWRVYRSSLGNPPRELIATPGAALATATA